MPNDVREASSLEVVTSIKINDNRIGWRVQTIAVRDGKLFLVGPERLSEQTIETTVSDTQLAL